MSDMYLILRRRLSEVTSEKEWVELGADVMKQARKARGLSYENIARRIPVSSKTYGRWEKRGAVPIELVDKIASLLGLEIERPEFKHVVTLEPAEALEQDERMERLETQQDRLEAQQAEALGMLARILDLLDDTEPESPLSDEG